MLTAIDNSLRVQRSVLYSSVRLLISARIFSSLILKFISSARASRARGISSFWSLCHDQLLKNKPDILYALSPKYWSLIRYAANTVYFLAKPKMPIARNARRVQEYTLYTESSIFEYRMKHGTTEHALVKLILSSPFLLLSTKVLA